MVSAISINRAVPKYKVTKRLFTDGFVNLYFDDRQNFDRAKPVINVYRKTANKKI